MNSPVTLQASVSGNGSGSTAGTLNWDPRLENQRAGLLLLNGVIYIGFASHCDTRPYHGWILSYNAATLLRMGAYAATPNGADSGIWMSGAGLASDGTDIFVATGNGTFDALTPPYNTSMDFGDDIIRLGATNGQLTPKDAFTPFNQMYLSSQDLDQGSGGVLLLPDQSLGGHPHLLVQVGKDGNIYLLDRDNLGGYCNGCSSNTNVLQELPHAVLGMWSMPAYWNNTVYFWGSWETPTPGDTLKAFPLINGRLSTSPTSHSFDVSSYPSPPPAISANGNTNGIVWTIKSDAYATSGPAVLHAYDAGNVATLLYSSDQNGTRDDTPGPAVKFAVPNIVNGKVFVGTENQLSVFGSLNVQQPPPTLASITPTSGGRGASVGVTLTGTNFFAGATINLSGTGITPSGLTVMNSTTITATFTIAANAPLGAQNVSVTTAGGTSGTVAFTVNSTPPPPTLASVRPSSDAQGTIIGVTLTGTNFIAGATINVSGTGVTPRGVTVMNGTTITATFTIASNATLGAHNVSVTTSAGTSGTVPFTVNAAPGVPTLTAISPSPLILGTAATFTLTGTNFVPGNTTINTSYAGLTVSNVTVASSTSMTATFALAASAQVGTAFFTVTTPSGTSNSFGIEVLGVPILNSITPANANPGSSLTVTLSGSRFLLAQIQFSGTGITASNRAANFPLFTAISYTFTIAANAPTGPQTITLTNAAGTRNGVPCPVNGSTRAPTLTSISPTSGIQGNSSLPVTLTGTNFIAGAAINFGGAGVTISNTTVVNSTTITAPFAIAANATTGAQNVSVTTTGGTSGNVTFTINSTPPPPTLASLNPSSNV